MLLPVHPSASATTTTRARPAASDSDFLLVGWAGPGLVSSMDAGDRAKNQQAEIRATIAPVGQQVTWKNPSTGNRGTVAPLSDSYAADGSYCRNFEQSITLQGQTQAGKDKACQLPDGSWKIAQ